MKIVSLYDMFSKNDSKSLKKQKRLLEIVCLDPGVELALPIAFSGLDLVWEYEINEIRNMHISTDDTSSRKYYVSDDRGKPFDKSRLKKTEGTRVYLVVRTLGLDALPQLTTMFNNAFDSILQVESNEYTLRVEPDCWDSVECERVFLICRDDKESNQLNVDDFDSMGLPTSMLCLCVDTLYSEYMEELVGMFPELSTPPKYILEKMGSIPHKYKNRPERLDCLVAAYKKFWYPKRGRCISIEEKNEINSKVKLFIRDSFDKLDASENEERSDFSQIRTGERIVNLSVGVVEPKLCSSSSCELGVVSHHVPGKLWILLCAAEFFWRDIERCNVECHPSGVHIEKVFKEGVQNSVSAKIHSAICPSSLPSK
ncbi:MAG: hypothetical protein K6L73_06345 [Cellvibrionaceae bacterium]